MAKQHLVDINSSGNVTVKDGNGNIIPITSGGSPVGGSGGTGGIAAGGFQQSFTYTASTTVSKSDSTFADITGMIDQTFSTPIGGPHQIWVIPSTSATSGNPFLDVQILLDGVTAIDVGPNWIGGSGPATSAFPMYATYNLPAGTHSIRPQWRVGSGPAGTLHTDVNQTWLVVIVAQGSGINGLNVAEFTIASNYTVTSAHPTYEQIGSTQVVLTTLDQERVNLSFNGAIQQVGATYGSYHIGYSVDGGAVIPTYHTDAPSTSSGVVFSAAFDVMTAPLSAGTHTIRLMGAQSGGSFVVLSPTNAKAESVFRGVRYGIGSTGAGATGTSTQLATSFTVSSVYPTYADVDSMSVAFNTQIANEQVLLLISGSSQLASGAGGTLYLGYKLDSGSDVPVTLVTPTTTNSGGDFSFAVLVTVASAGSHTLKFRAAADSGRTFNIFGANTAASTATITAVQLRGGLIPVKQSGNLIVQAPSALNFVGAGVVNDSGEAKITFPSAGTGGILKKLTYSPTGGQSTTSTSFTDQTGMVDQTFVTPITGDHIFFVEGQGYRTTGSATTFAIALNIDGTDYPAASLPIDTTGDRHFVGGFIIVSLVAGSHTIRPRWASGNGSTINNADSWQVSVQAQGSGVNGLDVVQVDQTADVTVSSLHPTYQATGIIATFNTLEQERVQVNFISQASASVSVAAIALGYRVDGGTTIPINVEHIANSGNSGRIDETFFTNPLSAGQHTIEIMVARGGAGNWVLQAAATDHVSRLQVVRYTSVGVGAGTIVTTAPTYTNNQTITSTSYIDAGSSVTINTIANEQVLVTFSAWMDRSNAGTDAANYMDIGVSVDGTDYTIGEMRCIAAGDARLVAFAYPVLIPTAGAHVIKLRARTNNSGTNWRIIEQDSADPKFKVTQYRGGLIPISDNAGNVVSKPTEIRVDGGIVTPFNSTGAKISFPNAALGGYMATLDYSTSAADTSVTSATFIDITNMSNQTFTTPVTGPHLFQFDMASMYASGGSGVRLEWALNIDGTDYTLSPQADINNDAEVPRWPSIVSNALVTLAAGAHTVRPRVRRVAGTGTAHVDGETLGRLLIQSQGSGINGLEVAESTLTSPFTVVANYNGAVAGGGMAQVDSVQCVINALEGERVLVIWNGYPSNVNTEHVIGYQVDSNPGVVTYYSAPAGSAAYLPGNWSAITPALSAGQHTIKLMAARAPSVSYSIAAASNVEPGLFQVIRFKSSGIGAGTLVNSSGVSGDTTITSVFTAMQSPGQSVTINTVANEMVVLEYQGSVLAGSGGADIEYGYRIDGGADVAVKSTNVDSVNTHDIGFALPIGPLTAGSHTIEFRIAKGSGGQTATLKGSSAGYSDNKLYVTQFRGGLIPIQQNGVTVVDKPTFQNYKAGAIVAANGSGVDISFPNAALGGYIQALSFNVAGANTTSASFTDINGITNQTFTTPVSGQHIITLYYNGLYATGASAYATFAVNIDGTDYTLGDSVQSLVGSAYGASALSAVVNLSAGSHTIRYRWLRFAGSGTLNFDSPAHKVVIEAQGTGINGLEIAEATFSSNFTASSALPTFASVTGASVTVTVLEQERVQLSFSGTALKASGANGSMYLAYTVDGGSDIPVNFIGESPDGANISFSLFTAPLSAGTHTFQLRAAVDSGRTFTIYGSAAPGVSVTPKWQAVRFKSNGIGAGTLVTSTNIDDTTVSSTSYANIGSALNINTIANETIVLSLNAYETSSGALDGSPLFLAYSLDGGTDVQVLVVTRANSNDVKDISFSLPVLITAPGAHTLRLRAKTSSGQSFVIRGTTDGNTSAFAATQYRGGLIPIKQSGTEIVNKPDALDFDAHMFDISASGLTASIKSNPKYTKQAGNYTSAGEAIIGITNVSVTRIVTISAADIAKGSTTRAYRITVKDESGSASPTTKITVTPATGTYDGVASADITAPYGSLKFYSDGTNLWSE